MNRNFFYLFFLSCILFLFSCQKEYSFEKGNVLPAEGSLWDSSGACLPDSVYGTFYNGITPGGDTAFVEIQVNVTRTGPYKIESDTVDGFNFYDSSTFLTTGINIVRLRPIGTPIIPATAVFTISFDSTVCSFSVLIQDSTGTGLGGGDTTGGNITNAWQFTGPAGSYAGTFDSAAIVSDSSAWNTGGVMLYMSGLKTGSADTAIALYVYLPSGVIVPGTYNTLAFPPSSAALFAFIDFDLGTGIGVPIYEALPGNTTNSNTAITITSYDAATHIVQGTFSGAAEDQNSNSVTVTNGSFTATVSP